MDNSHTEARNEHDIAQKPLIIFQESGKTYRPFTDPTRIRCIDSKKNRTNGVPEGFLQIMVPSSQTLSSLKQEKSASPDLKAVATLPPSASPGCEPQPDSESPSALREVSPFSYSCFPVSPSLSSSASSSSSSTRSSPFLPPTLLATPSTHQSSSPAYTPFPPQDHPRPSEAQTQGMFPPSCPKNRTSLPTWQASNEGLIGIDLEDPAVLAQALEIVRTMRIEDMDLDLDLLRPNHDAEHRRASAMDDRKTASLDGGIIAPLPLHTYPCEFLDRGY